MSISIGLSIPHDMKSSKMRVANSATLTMGFLLLLALIATLLGPVSKSHAYGITAIRGENNGCEVTWRFAKPMLAERQQGLMRAAEMSGAPVATWSDDSAVFVRQVVQGASCAWSAGGVAPSGAAGGPPRRGLLSHEAKTYLASGAAIAVSGAIAVLLGPGIAAAITAFTGLAIADGVVAAVSGCIAGAISGLVFQKILGGFSKKTMGITSIINCLGSVVLTAGAVWAAAKAAAFRAASVARQALTEGTAAMNAVDTVIGRDAAVRTQADTNLSGVVDSLVGIIVTP